MREEKTAVFSWLVIFIFVFICPQWGNCCATHTAVKTSTEKNKTSSVGKNEDILAFNHQCFLFFCNHQRLWRSYLTGNYTDWGWTSDLANPTPTLTLSDSKQFLCKLSSRACMHACLAPKRGGWGGGSPFFDPERPWGFAETVPSHCYDWSLRNHSDELWMRTGCNEQGSQPCRSRSWRNERRVSQFLCPWVLQGWRHLMARALISLGKWATGGTLTHRHHQGLLCLRGFTMHDL